MNESGSSMVGKLTYSKTKETVKKTTSSPTNMITKDYADILVNQLLNSTEAHTILGARSKLQFYDSKLKDLGLRATVKVGVEKIP